MEVFSIEGYRHLLITFQRSGYQFRLFSEEYGTRKVVYLRHDLDFWLAYALPIAEVESELGIRSSYFFLIDSEMYNPFTASGVSILRKISELGHYVGLHIDEENVRSKDNLIDQIESLKRIIPISDYRIVSRHRPKLDHLNNWITDEFIDTYDDKFFSDIEYASDSRGEWKYGFPITRNAFREGVSFQLLTHPLWWVNSGSNLDKINKMLNDKHQCAETSLNYLNFMK